MKTGVIFDLDGTLLDTLEDLLDATNHTLAHFGCPGRSLQELRRFVGNGAAHQMRCALPGRADDPALEQVLAFYRDFYNAHCRIKTAPYPGIREALNRLAEKYPLAIVSNKPDQTVKSLCRDFFGSVFALGERKEVPRKPAPQMVFAAMEAIGAERCVYVGDSEVDVATAANAGIPCLSVTWGFRDTDTLKAAGAARFCSRTEDLPAAVEEIVRNCYGK